MRHDVAQCGYCQSGQAQPDLDIMTHLLHADMFVSNEAGFAKKAFNDIWTPRQSDDEQR